MWSAYPKVCTANTGATVMNTPPEARAKNSAATSARLMGRMSVCAKSLNIPNTFVGGAGAAAAAPSVHGNSRSPARSRQTAMKAKISATVLAHTSAAVARPNCASSSPHSAENAE